MGYYLRLHGPSIESWNWDYFDFYGICQMMLLWTGFASASRGLWVRPCDHCFGRMDLIEQDTNTPVDKASNWYVLFRTKRGKRLPFLIMIYKLQLWMRSSKVSSLCSQCSDRKYSFSSSATSWFRTPNFRRSKATDKDAGEAAYRRSNSFQRFDRTDLVYRRIAVHRRIDYQRIGVSDSNVQHNKFVHRRIGVHRRIDYHESAYQIPTFNQQIGTPANQRTQANRLPLIGVSDSNVQHNRLVHRRIGVHRRIDYHHSAYQIQTSNTTDWYTGEAAYRRPATGDRRVAVSDSNVQHNRLVHRQSGVPATGESPYQIPTFNTTDWYTGEAAYRRPASRRIRFQRSTQQIGTPARRRTGDRRPATGDRRPATGDRRPRRPASRRINFQRKRRWNRFTHQLRSIDDDRLSTPRCQRPQPG